MPWAASALAATLSFPLLVLVADAVGLPADLAAERQPPERPWPEQLVEFTLEPDPAAP